MEFHMWKRVGLCTLTYIQTQTHTHTSRGLMLGMWWMLWVCEERSETHREERINEKQLLRCRWAMHLNFPLLTDLLCVCVQTCWRSQTSAQSSSSSTRWATTCSTPATRWQRSTTTPSTTWSSAATASVTATPPSAPRWMERRLELRAWYTKHMLNVLYFLDPKHTVSVHLFFVCRSMDVVSVTTTQRDWTVSAAGTFTMICRGDLPRAETPTPARVRTQSSLLLCLFFCWWKEKMDTTLKSVR